MFLFSLIVLHLINAHPQLNLYYTDEVYQDQNEFYHDCLRVVGMTDFEKENLFYCLSESPSQFHINIDETISKFTFDELKQKNISVEQHFINICKSNILQLFFTKIHRCQPVMFIYNVIMVQHQFV